MNSSISERLARIQRRQRERNAQKAMCEEYSQWYAEQRVPRPKGAHDKWKELLDKYKCRDPRAG